MKEFTPYMKAKTAYDTFLFTLYIQSGISKGTIPYDIFNKPLIVTAEDSEVTISPKRESINVNGLADNLRLTVVADCFIVFDEALDQVFGEKPTEYSDTDIDALRAIIYMMRCAFAHTPTEPIWRITKQSCKKEFKIKEIDFAIDFGQLDGKEMTSSHHAGWLGLWGLMQYCLAIIKKHSV